MTRPRTGDVWRYPHLWAWQAERGETEGRKPRPVTLANATASASDTTRLHLLPITDTSPDTGQDALEISATELRRAGLTEAKRFWIVVDDHNRDTFETSFHFEPDARIGRSSRTFPRQIAARFQAAYLHRKTARDVERSE